jgi:hypothetical protein
MMRNRLPVQRLQRLQRLLRLFSRAAFMLSALAVLTGPSWAQDVAAENAVSRTYLNKFAVNLPVEIEPAYRGQLQGLVLFMKEGARGSWSVQERGGPQQTSFTFKAQREGEYWFRIVAVDKQGRSHPDDLNKDIQDAVVVVIDTTPPAVELNFLGSNNDGTVVQCEVRDANPDALKLRFFYQTADQVWRTLDPQPSRPGAFCLPRQAVLTNLVKVVATDLAGNTTTRAFNLGELATTGTSRPTNLSPALAPPPPVTVGQAPATIPPAPTADAQPTQVPQTRTDMAPPPVISTGSTSAHETPRPHDTPRTIAPSIAGTNAPTTKEVTAPQPINPPIRSVSSGPASMPSAPLPPVPATSPAARVTHVASPPAVVNGPSLEQTPTLHPATTSDPAPQGAVQTVSGTMARPV